MKRSHWILVLVAVWVVSLAAAFMAGRSDTGVSAALKSRAAGVGGAASGPGSAASGGFATGVGGTAEPGGGPKAILSADDIKKELKSAMEDPDLLQRGMRLRKLLDGLNAENLQTVLAAFEDVGTDSFENLEAYRLLIYAWSRFSPAESMAYAMERLGMRGAFVAQPALANWVQKDPESALKWAKGLTGSEGQFAVGGVLMQMATTNPAEATRRLASLESSPAYGRYAQVVADQFARQDPKGAVAWAQTLKDPSAKQRALEEVVRTWAGKDADAAADWMRKNAGNYQMPGAVSRVASELAQANPSGAINWATQLPQGENRSAALASAVGEWAEKDPNSAGNWINSHVTAGPEGDRIIASYANNVANTDPSAAITWAQSISDEGARMRSTAELGRRWFRQDPKAAEVWLQSASLPDQVKQEIARSSRFGGDSGPPWRRGDGRGPRP